MAASSSSSVFLAMREEDQIVQQHTLAVAPPSSAQPQSSSANSQKKRRNQPGTPNPDAEVIALSPKTLMAKNRFVCEVCSKGFQREQNLQLHRRGHNLPWKLKQKTTKEVKRKVYLCPEPSCVHHEPSRALGDLTGIKKHYSRKHGEKKFKCEKCSKKYAVQSDWKAHSKTCGTREYRCDCGTLFSRRDSFITHRAFCDALAQETARNPTTLGGIGSSLFGSSNISNNNISLGLSHHLPSHISAGAGNHDHHHHLHHRTSAADILRLGNSRTVPQFDSLIGSSMGCAFRSPPPPPMGSSSYYMPAAAADQSVDNNQGFLQTNNRTMHGALMQMADHELHNNSPNSSSTTPNSIFNLSFLPGGGGNNNNGSSDNNAPASMLLFNDNNNGITGATGGGGNIDGISLFSGALMGEHMSSGIPSLYSSTTTGGMQTHNIGGGGGGGTTSTTHMSATALLQKAVQMGSTTSNNSHSSFFKSFGGTASSNSRKSDNNNPIYGTNVYGRNHHNEGNNNLHELVSSISGGGGNSMFNGVGSGSGSGGGGLNPYGGHEEEEEEDEYVGYHNSSNFDGGSNINDHHQMKMMHQNLGVVRAEEITRDFLGVGPAGELVRSVSGGGGGGGGGYQQQQQHGFEMRSLDSERKTAPKGQTFGGLNFQ